MCVHTGPNERKSIEDIDCSFTTEVKRVTPSKNKQSLGMFALCREFTAITIWDLCDNFSA